MVEYEVEGRIVVIKGCSKDEIDITLPEKIDGLPVGKIDDNAFAEVSNLRRIVIPKTVKLIGNYAFAGCKNLSEVILEEGVETIEDWAFISCRILKINLPTSLKSIGPNCFLGNKCRAQVEDFVKNRENVLRRKKKEYKHKATVFPITLLGGLDMLTHDVIENRSIYYQDQFNFMNNGNIDFSSLDIPFAFDKDEFIIALYADKPLSNFKIDLTHETKTTLGMYHDDDPDYVICAMNVYTADEFIDEVAVKTPYLEDANLQIIDIVEKQIDDIYYYYLQIKADLMCFGNGNIDREFALNLYDELSGKYMTQLQNNLINDEKYEVIKAKIEEYSLTIVQDFMKEVKGAPILHYAMDLYASVLMDEEIEAKESIMAFVNDKLFQIYSTLSDYDSFEEFCFNVDDTLDALATISGISIDDLCAKYNISVRDDNGNPIDSKAIELMKQEFINVEANYKLHADILYRMYIELKDLNREFSILAFQE